MFPPLPDPSKAENLVELGHLFYQYHPLLIKRGVPNTLALVVIQNLVLKSKRTSTFSYCIHKLEFTLKKAQQRDF